MLADSYRKTVLAVQRVCRVLSYSIRHHDVHAAGTRASKESDPGQISLRYHSDWHAIRATRDHLEHGLSELFD